MKMQFSVSKKLFLTMFVVQNGVMLPIAGVIIGFVWIEEFHQFDKLARGQSLQ